MSWKWNDFIKEGNILFKCMINNFKKMFDENSLIKEFNIVDRRCRFRDEINKINFLYKNDIHNKLTVWINNEYIENRLNDINNWKPFRDLESINDMYMGYNKMFNYNQYYFQLSIDSYYNIDINDIDNKDIFVYFELVLYGWKDIMFKELQPDNYVIIPNDNIMPLLYWEIK